MSRVRVQIMNQFHRKSHEYKAIKRYWKLIQQDSRKLSDKRFYRPTFRPNIKILDIINMDTHKEIIAKLDYEAPSCPDCGSLMKKYDFQKPSKIPYLETTGMPSRILLRKRRFKCYHCSKMMVAETPLVKKNHQIPRIINQKIAQKLIEKISMTDIAHQLAISTSTVIRKLNDFHFECNFRNLPEIMSWEVETVRGVTVSIGRWR
ncbi:degenerate transposase [Streptococcus pneumoniae]|nr:degenerate transposase [Streptococcus pneumoniae]VSG67059.1 degenerate transposase [Streptococcus pneumoniae]